MLQYKKGISKLIKKIYGGTVIVKKLVVKEEKQKENIRKTKMLCQKLSFMKNRTLLHKLLILHEIITMKINLITVLVTQKEPIK